MFIFRYSIPRSCSSAGQLQTTLNNHVRNLRFVLLLEDKSVTNGVVSITNTEKEEIDVYFENNLAFLLGISELGVLKNKSVPSLPTIITIGPKANVKFNFDMSRPIKELSLYSDKLINYNSEIAYKKMAQVDIITLLTAKQSHDFIVISFNAPKFIIDSKYIKESTFCFKNSLNDPLYFEYAELIVFFNKI